jgi:hypothetical protein
MRNQPSARLIVIVLLLAVATAPPRRILAREKNRPPVIANDAIITTAARSDVLGQIVEVTTSITVQASDPDGDVLTFRWTASSGAISGKGPTGTWKRELTSSGAPAPGTATVVVTDGRGGRATHTFTAK